jgi:hypothetical protein
MKSKNKNLIILILFFNINKKYHYYNHNYLINYQKILMEIINLIIKIKLFNNYKLIINFLMIKLKIYNQLLKIINYHIQIIILPTIIPTPTPMKINSSALCLSNSKNSKNKITR